MAALLPMSEERAPRLDKFRPKAKWPFVAFNTIVFTLGQLVARVLADWVFGDPVRLRLSTVIISVVFGFLASLIIWSLVLRRNKERTPDRSA